MSKPISEAIADRHIAPTLLPIEHISFVAPQISILSNGAKLFWRNGLQNETSKIELHFAAGSATSDPLTASLCAGLLINGTASKSAKQIQKALDAVGAYYDVSLSQESCDTLCTQRPTLESISNLSRKFIFSCFSA
jgi:hypothetical protein